MSDAEMNDKEKKKEKAKRAMHPKKRKAIKWCAAINCSNSKTKNPDLTFFGFPKDPVLSRKWVVACRRKDLMTKTAESLWKGTAFCEKHFEAKCFKSTEKKLLAARAVPSIFDFRKSHTSPKKMKQRLSKSSPAPQPLSSSTDDATLAPSTSTEDRKPMQDTMYDEAHLPISFDTEASNHNYDGNNLEQLYQRFRDDVTNIVSEAAGDLAENTKETADQVLKIRLPFKVREMMTLVMEYLHVYDTIQRMKELARINMDLLYRTTDEESKKEVDKVQELIHTLMNGREVYKIEISNFEEKVNVSERGDGKNKGSAGHDWDFDVEYKDSGLLQHGVSVKQELISVSDEEIPVGDDGRVRSTRDDFYKKTLKNRLELEKYLESLESHDSFGARFCKFCDTRFKGKAPLRLHLVKHLRNRRHICRFCGKQYRDKTPLTRHLKSSHQDETSAPEEQQEELSTLSEDVDAEGEAEGEAETEADSSEQISNDSQVDTKENLDLEKVATVSSTGSPPKKPKLVRDTPRRLPKSERDVSDDTAREEPHRKTSTSSTPRVESYDKKLKNRQELDQYLESPESHCDSGSRFCKFCDRKFKTKHALGAHLVKHLENKFFTCEQCGKEYREANRLKKHVLSHKPSDHNECTECGKVFPSKYTLYQHRKLTHSFNPEFVLCSICGVTLQTKSLRRHIKTHTECLTERKYICHVCGKAYSSECYLKSHERAVHIHGTVGCQVCGKKILKNNLKRHMRLHNGENPYKCNYCDKAFPQSTQRDAHQRRHTGQYPHHCSYCNKGFNAPGYLRIHERLHTGEKPFPCTICGKLFVSMTLAKIHETSHTHPDKNSGEKRFKCSHCNKMFAQGVRLASHMFSAHKKELDRCLLCNDGVIFASLYHLESHMKTVHWNEKPFQCRTCGEAFYMFRDYYAHKTLHNHEEKEFKCGECGKSFSVRISLQRHHILKHTGQPLKPYECDICGRQFNSKANHMRHRQAHSGVKPFKCSVCGSAFAQKVTLESHLWTHTNAKKYQCGKCDRGFNDKRNYVSHVKKSHPEVMMESGRTMTVLNLVPR